MLRVKALIVANCTSNFYILSFIFYLSLIFLLKYPLLIFFLLIFDSLIFWPIFPLQLHVSCFYFISFFSIVYFKSINISWTSELEISFSVWGFFLTFSTIFFLFDLSSPFKYKKKFSYYHHLFPMTFLYLKWIK